MKIRIEDVRIAFPAIAAPQAFGDGEPAYGGRFIIVPGSANAKLLAKTFKEVADEMWKDKGPSVLKALRADKKMAYIEQEYLNKEGVPYDGFADSYYLQTRNAKVQPGVFNKYNERLTSKSDIERTIYGGCYVTAQVEVWAQDNKYGRRLNCNLLGLIFRADGPGFGGGAAPSSDDDFADLAASLPEAEDLV
jgi:hypothetical protein